MSPKIRFIVLLGPDGCGKTTVIDLLESSLDQSNRPLELCTFNFGTLPSLSSLFGRKRLATAEGTENVGMVTPLNTIRCQILCFWYGIDLIFGHIKLRRNPEKLFLFSRFYMDFFYQRAYRKAPHALIRFFMLLGPKPDLIIVLRREPADIYQQKPELSPEEINLQYELIRANLSYHRGYREIDASQGIEATIENVLSVMKG